MSSAGPSVGGPPAAAAGGSALTEPGPFGDLLTDRAPAGSPVTGLLMGCRARLGVSTLSLGRRCPGCCDLASWTREGLRVLLIGDDWAEDHHDVEIEDEGGRRLARARR